MLYCSIIIIGALIYFAKVIFKDILSPAVLIGVPWLLSMLLLVFSHFDFDVNSIYFLYFALGIFVFQVGYTITCSKKVRSVEKQYNEADVFVNNSIIKVIMLTELAILIIYGIILANYIRSSYVFNALFTLKIGAANGTIPANVFIEYFISFTLVFTGYIVFAFIKSKNLKNKEIIIITQLIIGMLYLILSLGRTGILLYCIMIFAELIVLLNVENKVIFKYSVILGVVGVLFFSIYNIAKYPFALETRSPIELSLEYMSTYASSSLVLFQKWAASSHELLYGGNTLRFFDAVLKGIGYNINVQGLIHPFLSIGNNTSSNVYTIYYFYGNDFGLIYAFIMQFLFGMVHGFLYKKMILKKPIWIFLFSISLYPLFMQFFEDQYIALTSSWLQYAFYGLILFNTKLFIQFESSDKLK